jgi:hypothetical protein
MTEFRPTRRARALVQLLWHYAVVLQYMATTRPVPAIHKLLDH